MDETYTWGISGGSFLWLYAALCVATAIGVYLLRRGLLNAGAGALTPPELSVYELALLNGGPRLAITSAVAKLHNDGAVATGAKDKTIVAVTRPADGDELEHEVYSAVERTSGISSRALRRELERCGTIRQMATKLTDAGLLLGEGRRALVNSLWLGGAAIAAVGVARIVAGMLNGRAVGLLVVIVVAVGLATMRFARLCTYATARGLKLLDGRRGGSTRIAHTPVGAEIPLAVALYGTGVLWAADPGIASAWAVPREHAWASGGGSSGSTGSSCGGGGGCGGGGCGG